MQAQKQKRTGASPAPALLAGTAWNLKKMMKKLKEKILWLIFKIFLHHKFYPIKCDMGYC
jgi:hypothetical protein